MLEVLLSYVCDFIPIFVSGLIDSMDLPEKTFKSVLKVLPPKLLHSI